MSLLVAPPWTVKVFETLSVVLLGAQLVLSKGISIEDVIWVPLYLWLILSVSRKKSRLGRGIFTALSALAFVLVVAAISTSSGAELAVISSLEWLWATVVGLVAAFQVWLVWSPPTTRWLATKGKAQIAPSASVR